MDEHILVCFFLSLNMVRVGASIKCDCALARRFAKRSHIECRSLAGRVTRRGLTSSAGPALAKLDPLNLGMSLAWAASFDILPRYLSCLSNPGVNTCRPWLLKLIVSDGQMLHLAAGIQFTFNNCLANLRTQHIRTVESSDSAAIERRQWSL